MRVPSVVGREQPALEVFADEASRIGLGITRLPFTNGPVKDPRAGIAPPTEGLTGDRYQVLASTAGDGALRLLLNGHLDVVPAESSELWTSPPFTPQRRDGWLYGRGAADMKSGFAVGLLALRALGDLAPDLFARQRLGFLAVIEEECTGNGTLRSLSEHNIRAEEVVLLEPTDLGLLVGGVGVMWADIGVTTRAGHAHASSNSGNAIELGMRVVERLRQWSGELWRDYPEPNIEGGGNPYNLNLGQVKGGDWRSSVPPSANFGIRVGYPRSWTAEEAEDALRGVVAEFARLSEFPIAPQVTLTGFRARGYQLDSSNRLVRDLSAAHQAAHGVAPPVFSLGTTTDARVYINDFDIPAVCYGAVARDMHGTNECVELQSIVDAARTLARFILRRFDVEAAA